MKNLLMIAITFVTIATTAQDRKKEAPKGEMKERMEMRQSMTPEESAKLQTKKMTLALDLNEKQQAEVEKILLEEATTRKAKMEEMKAKKENAEGKKPSKEDHLKMANERLDHQIEMKKKMKAILNAEQYEKFEKMQGKRQGMMRGKKAEMKMHKE
jgi:hypothetical protein